jgi:prepilin-type N-terminal cleavage/methylation domain-containing protein
MNRSHDQGFTLIELIVVVAVIAVLAGAAVSYFGDSVTDARHAVVRQNLGMVREALSRYFKDRMEYPTKLESLTGPYMTENPVGLLVTPVGQENPQLEVEVPAGGEPANAFQAKVTEWKVYDSTGTQGQIRAVRLRLNGVVMPW